jgi:hypothetical protein
VSLTFTGNNVARLDRMERLLWVLVRATGRLTDLEGQQVAIIDDLRSEVEAMKGVQASAVTLINGLSDKLDEALAGGDMNQVVAVVAEIRASTEALAAAVAANPVPEPGAPPA